MRTLSLRAIFLLGFVIAMPLLALPTVARRLDDWLYGPPPADLSHSPLRHEQQAIQPQSAERVSPASFDEITAPATLLRRQPHEGLDALGPTPPLLDPLPAFDRLATAPEAATSAGASAADAQPITPLSDATASRLEQIRTQLETLGAQYVLLETTDDSGSYRFHCQLRLGDQPVQTRTFEATAADPLAAAERVLAEVSASRISARERKIR